MFGNFVITLIYITCSLNEQSVLCYKSETWVIIHLDVILCNNIMSNK